MHILYLDESGTHGEARHFVLAGLSVFERETYFLARQLEQLQEEFFPGRQHPLNLRASELRAPDERAVPPFDELTATLRIDLLIRIYRVIAESRVRLFGIAIEKAQVAGSQYERGFEDIISRFDQMLSRMGREQNEQRGLIVVAESSYRENLASLAQQIARHGHRWGETHNLADIPYFAPAGSTRLLQLADFVSNSVFRRYERGDTRSLDTIMPRFDQDAGRIHGLAHLTSEPWNCYCPACLSRRPGPPAPTAPAAASDPNNPAASPQKS